MRNRLAHTAALATAVALLWTWLVTAACAHASLITASPQDGSMLATAPQELSLRFSEPVSPLSLRLIAPGGASQSLDDYALRDRTLVIRAPAALGQGTHVLSWRVVSEDGHPVGGSVVFSIGEASAEPPAVEDTVDWPVRLGLWGAKLALYLGLFFGVGGVAARQWLFHGGGPGGRPVAAALLAGLAGALAAAGFQGLDALGAQAGRIADPLIWSAGMATSFGRTVILALAALAAAGAALAVRPATARLAAPVALVLAGAALTASGHASAADPQWLMRPAVFVHVAAIACWTGALLPLGLALKHREPQAVPALLRFSHAIPWAVALLAAAGLLLGIVQVGRPSALIDTAYGRVFLVKLALLVALFILAAVNRWTLTAPAAAGDAGAVRRLARSIATETAIVVLIFAVAACWRFTPPPRALDIAAAEPASVHIHTAEAMADVSIRPGRAGPVTASIVVMTGDFGPLEAKEVALVLSNTKAGIEPIRRSAVKPGDGTWRVDGLVLPVAGSWKLRVDILVTDFDLVRLDGEVDIRR